jgi:hypothetical protein
MAGYDIYEIRIEGCLRGEWSGWFEGLTISTQPPGETVLTGPVADQAALYGLLIKMRDLGIPLVSVHRIEPSG